MKKTINQVINGKEYSIIVDHSSIAAKTSTGLYPIMKLSRNKDYVIKFNRTTISTCNSEMLIYLIENDIDIMVDIVNHISRIADHAGRKISKSEFYNSFNNDLSSWLKFFENVTPETKREILTDHITFDHAAKMSGIISLSTYVGKNRFCLARRDNCDNAICKYCYASSLTGQRYHLKMRLIRLHIIFTMYVLSENDIPVLNAALYPYFRFESFGDINNEIQINNYNLFAAVNPDINFTLWTKNPGIIQNAINNGMVQSDNLIIGLSSLYLNTPELDKAQKYNFIRFLFTVYDNDYIREHNVIINCGAKHCITCGLCYKYLHEFKHGLQLINERKK